MTERLKNAVRDLPPGKAGSKLVSPDKPLTELERRLVKEIADGNAVITSAIRAGYENTPSLKKNIYDVVAKPNVAREIARLREAVTQSRQFTREKAFDMLQEAFDMGKLMAEPMAMVGATREMIKMAGYNAPIKVDLSVSGSVQIEKMNQLSDAQLLEIMSKAENVEMLHDKAVGAPMLEHTPADDGDTPEDD